MPRSSASQAARSRVASNTSSSTLWETWLQAKKGRPFPFQRETWQAYLEGKSGLVHAPTGVGKTYAVWGGPVREWLAQHPDPASWPKSHEPLQVLWITPLRALANDSVESLQRPLQDLGMPWSVELRTGDTSSSVRQRQRRRFPTVLVTTPESLSLLLTHEDTREKFAHLKAVMVDEWHELLSSKRGVQTELCLARLRTWLPDLKTWGLSATLGNLTEAMEVLLGTKCDPGLACLISAPLRKKFELKTLIPKKVERFPWAGHAGLSMLPQVIKQIEAHRSTLLFTNTRSQTERWFKALQEARPDWSEQIALHHGSIDRAVREEVEAGLRQGTLRCVVCTGSLDLGVDFSPVEQVIQVGAPKGVARILQRAGRSGHQPGAVSRLIGVPAHALEFVEFAAVRDAARDREIEARKPLDRPLDVLVQHLVSLALGGGFESQAALNEIRSTHAYRNLSEDEWKWVLEFIVRGGQALRAYPQFHRVEQVDGRYVMTQPELARFHRLSIGTISSDASVSVRLQRGGHLGSVEESFIARLKPGDVFSFAGRQLELVRVWEMTATVRVSKKPSRTIPQWLGGYMPLSSELAHAVRRKLSEAREGIYDGPEMKAIKPVLKLHEAWSHIPSPQELLIETAISREGMHYFIYPFAGRLAHEGLATLVAHRLSKLAPRTFHLTMNDYGFALTSLKKMDLDLSIWRDVLSTEHLREDMTDCLNTGELAKRKFREISRIAGLVFQGYPSQGKSTRQVQASSGLFYDVFKRYEPDHLLLEQARREVLQQQLEYDRIHGTLEAVKGMELKLIALDQLSPMSFPLWATWMQGQVSSETWNDRVKQMAEKLEVSASRLAIPSPEKA